MEPQHPAGCAVVSFASGNTESVVFRYPPRRDTFHDLIPGSGRDVPVEGCLFHPGPGRENEVHAQQVAADGTLYAPSDAPALSAQDQVVIRGEVYEVVERPRYWLEEGFEIPVKIVSG